MVFRLAFSKVSSFNDRIGVFPPYKAFSDQCAGWNANAQIGDFQSKVIVFHDVPRIGAPFDTWLLHLSGRRVFKGYGLCCDGWFLSVNVSQNVSTTQISVGFFLWSN